jgi:hypothetical protein
MTRIIALTLAALLAAGTSASAQRNLTESIIWACIQNPRLCSDGEYLLTIVNNSNMMIRSVEVDAYGGGRGVWTDFLGTPITNLAPKETHSVKLRQTFCTFTLRITWANGHTQQRAVNDACKKQVLMALE